jgi:hypothetical protein
MASNWFYAKQGQQIGPVSSGQLRELARAGHVLPTDLVWKQGMASWVPGGSLPDLFPQGAAQFPAPPAPQQAVAAIPAQVAPASYPPQGVWPGNDSRNAAAKPWHKTMWFRLTCVAVGVMILLCGGIMGLMAVVGEHGDVKLVRNGYLEANKSMTIGKAVDGFMSNPKWEAIKGTDGKRYVNVSGGITYQDKPVNAMFQFHIERDKKTFECTALEFNGVPQNKLMMMLLLSKMYNEPQK